MLEQLSSHERRIARLTAILLACTALAGCGHNQNASSEKETFAYTTEDFALDKSVPCLSIHWDAKLRSGPEVDYTNQETQAQNLIVQLALDHSQTVVTPDGVAEVTDFKNGPWYGVTVEDLDKNAAIGPLLPASQPDDLVWVSSQKTSFDCQP